MIEAQPLAGLGSLARAAQASRAAAAGLRWLAACAMGFAGLLVLSLALAGFERSGSTEPAETSASAYLDFDLAVLRIAALRNLGGGDASAALWAHRPDWGLRPAPSAATPLVPLREAWAASVAEKSRFRTAARGAAGALPFLLGGLALVFVAAAAAGALARLRHLRWLAAALIVVPLWAMVDPEAFYDRTRSLGPGLLAAWFVAAFAAALPGAAARAVFAQAPQPAHLVAVGGRRALFTAARLAALDAGGWLVPLVPALATAALFVCAKADHDPAAAGAASGFGALVRAAMREAGVAERLSSCALVAGGLVLLWFLGHRFVLEVRSALGARAAT